LAGEKTPGRVDRDDRFGRRGLTEGCKTLFGLFEKR